MDQSDRDVLDAVNLLAAVVNRYGKVVQTSAGACPVVELPLGLVIQIREHLRERWLGTEFSSLSIKQAVERDIWTEEKS